MKFAKGSKEPIIISLLPILIFILLYIVFLGEIVGFVLLFFAIVMSILTVILLIFFRDPDRKIGSGIVAVADGKIRNISKIIDEDVGSCVRVSTFMNINNVHVNRMPLNGVIKSLYHIKGGFIPAFKKESERNERVIFTIQTDIGLVKIILIAGTLARRIVPYVLKGDKLKKGEKIGIIRLGSRVDLYLPTKKNVKFLVKVGDHVKAGESSIGKIND